MRCMHVWVTYKGCQKQFSQIGNLIHRCWWNNASTIKYRDSTHITIHVNSLFTLVWDGELQYSFDIMSLSTLCVCCVQRISVNVFIIQTLHHFQSCTICDCINSIVIMVVPLIEHSYLGMTMDDLFINGRELASKYYL